MCRRVISLSCAHDVACHVCYVVMLSFPPPPPNALMPVAPASLWRCWSGEDATIVKRHLHGWWSCCFIPRRASPYCWLLPTPCCHAPLHALQGSSNPQRQLFLVTCIYPLHVTCVKNARCVCCCCASTGTVHSNKQAFFAVVGGVKVLSCSAATEAPSRGCGDAPPTSPKHLKSSSMCPTLRGHALCPVLPSVFACVFVCWGRLT